MDGKLERLERDLSDPNKEFKPVKRNVLERTSTSVTPSNWQRIPVAEGVKPKKPKTFLDKLFIGSLIFFSLALLAALSAWIFDWGAVSSEKIGITIVGEEELTTGTESSFIVSVENKNTDPIQDARIIISFPQGMRDRNGKDFVRETKEIGFIGGNEKHEEEFTFIPFGQVDDIKDVLIRLEYTVPGSTVIFSLEEKFSARIESSPLTFSAEFPEVITPGQEFSFTFSFASSARESIANLLLNLEFPEGFVFKTSSLAKSGNNQWAFPTLEPGEKQTMTVTGIFDSNQVRSEKTFRFEMGTGIGANGSISAPLLLESHTVPVEASPLVLRISLPPSRIDNGVLKGSGVLPVTLSWSNNARALVTDAELTLNFDGDAWDLSNARTKGVVSGQTIRWTEGEIDDLASIQSGASESVDASVEVNPRASTNLSIVATLRGSVNGRAKTILSTTELPLKLSQDVELIVEPQRNPSAQTVEGPYPPQVGVASSYAVAFSVISDQALTNAVTTFVLPQNVSIVQMPPSRNGNSFMYNQSSRVGTWTIPRVSAGSGSVTTPPRIEVLLSIVPSSSDLGKEATLVQSITLNADDSRGDTKLFSRVEKVTTEASDSGQRGIVQNP